MGLEVVKQALLAGDIVTACVRKQSDAERIKALGAHTAILDVRERSAVFETVQSVTAKHGRIDIAFNNAGYGLIGPIEEASEAEARTQFDVNFFGALWFIQAVTRVMRAQASGHIITVTSVSGLAAWAGTGLYTASKFALEGLCQTLHDEVEELGIDVTNIAPGGLRTNFAKGSMTMTQRHISGYDGIGRLPQRVYKDNAGKEPGDPAKAAAAVLKIAGIKNPPLHLLLGDDALGYWRASQAAMAQEIDANESLTCSIAVDPD